MAEDERPRPARPQYGEYASPEQVAQAFGKRPIPPLRTQPEPLNPPPPPPPLHQDPVRRPPTRVRQPSMTNVFITWLLILFAIYNFVVAIPTDLALGTNLNARLAQLNFPTYPDPGAIDRAGPWLIAINAVFVVAVIVCSMLLMRRNRLSFWVPIAGFILFSIVAAILLAFVFSADPAYLQKLTEQLGSTG